MTRLLVSVRDAAEARIAVEEGVDLIDLKEPRRGSLGRVDAATVRDVIEVVAGGVPLSMALGELVDYVARGDDETSPDAAISDVPVGLRYVKLGLAGCGDRADWPDRWRALAIRLPRGIERVYVVYADAAVARAPAPAEINEQAAAAGARAVLVDTHTKDGRNLFDFWTAATLGRFIADVRRRGMLAVVGGGLTTLTIPQAAASGADYIAVRGAACDGPRTGTVSADRIRAIRRLLG